MVIREDLTKSRQELLLKAQKQFGYKNVWTSNGKIHWVEVAEDGEPQRMTAGVEQLCELLP